MHLRRKLVAGNWKMNGSLAALPSLRAIAAAAREAAGVDVAICPPFTLIAPGCRACGRPGDRRAGLPSPRASGAHTGCVSAAMLKEAGRELVIVGHSERRAEQHETDAEVRAKAEAALAPGLTAIVCVGESEAERRRRAMHRAWSRRSSPARCPTLRSEAELVVAYEPIWAIGTGRIATPADVAEMHAAIRAALAAPLGEPGERIRILYGGSVKADNAAELFAVADVDGALVGGASLTAAQFVPIIEAAARELNRRRAVRLDRAAQSTV